MSAHQEHAHTNRLIQEKSPYLLQHAHNPVDWYPWGDEALEKARAEDKLLLVSIGYATCHWCHVMERESFEDESVAAFLNRYFVSIKVDREERPDVDKVYMDSLQAMGQQGGWPLNMFATPDGRPVAGGTYFPPQDMYGRMSFRRVLETLVQVWQNDRQAIYQNADILADHLRQHSQLTSDGGEPFSAGWVDAAAGTYQATYDARHGGFTYTGQNKFPPSMGLQLLLRHHARTGDEQSLEMAATTLRRMREGGVYDQIGGGLHRYATDHQWRVPHFEKMLYDNALFAQACTETHQVTGEAFYREAAEDVLAYLLRDMHAPEGAFYSAEDADSEGVEGRFYVWTPQQVREVLDAEEARCALAYWHIADEGDFEHGTSIPHSPRPMDEVATELGVEPGALAGTLQQARDRLLAARSGRVRPLRDDKILTSWNGLAVSAFARAGRAFAEPRYREVAAGAARFVLTRLRDDEGRLLRRYREGAAGVRGYLTDYAQMAVACLDLYEATYEPYWFEEALGLVREADRLFRNPEGPYFDTGSDTDPLITRTMEGYDGVEPSGNSALAQALVRLHAYGVREGFVADAGRILSGFREHLERAGIGYPAMLAALDFHTAPPREVAIVGPPEEPETRAMQALVQTRFLRAAVSAFASPEGVAEAARSIPLLEGRQADDGRPTAWVCRELACRLPVHTAAELERQLLER